MSLIRARYRAVNTIMNLPRGGYVGLLDLFPNAAAAYSLRKLRAAYSGSAVRVRRSSDNTEQDIGFTTQGELDTTSLLSFVNARDVAPADYGAGAAAAYSLRYVSDSYTGNVVRVRRSVDNAEADFNPTEITDGTLLSWVGGVNLLLFSEQFDNPYYLKLLGTLTTNQTSAPDGSLTADLFTKTSGINTVSELRANGVYSSTGIHTYSIYVKQNVGDSVLLRLDAAGNTANASFNFSTKTISTSGANLINATATELSDGWFRLSVTANVTNTSWGLSIANLFSNPTNDSIFVWGAQLELGSTVTTYTETTDAPAGYGYVTTWYDQSGNSNDATQGTAASQPKIVDAGVLVEENGKPAVEFDGVDDEIRATLNLPQPFTAFAIGAGTKSNNTIFDGNSDRSFLRALDSDTCGIFSGTALNTGNLTASNYKLLYGLYNGANSATSFNGQALTVGNAGTDGLGTILIGAGSAFTTYEGPIQEIIIYPSNQSTNRGNIEANVNDYYSIYTSTNDGFVTTWYDQSLSNDATQSTAAAQPKIVSGGSLVVMGGASKAAIEGSISSLSLTTALTPTDFSIIHTSEGSGFVANIGEYIRISNYYRYNIDGNNYISSYSDSSQPSIYIGNRNGTTLNLRRNGSEMDSSPHTSVATALNITTIFNRSTLYFVGKISEFIIFESNQSSNFSGIETNLNTFYSIYP